MQKLNAPYAELARILPFVRRTAAPPEGAGVDAGSIFRPRVVACSAEPAALAPGAALRHDARNAFTSLRLLVSLLNEPDVLNAPYKQAGLDLQLVASLLEGLFEKATISRPERPVMEAAKKQTRKTSSRAKQPQGADEALDGCTQLLRTIAGTHVDVYVSAESGLPPLALSNDELLRILMNLVLNASEAMPGGGIVRITARRALSREMPAVLLHVSDTGPGIPRLALPRIFEPGFTSKRSGPNSACSGLGLTIVHDLLQTVGGVIKVASTRGRGTTFELRIPCRRAGRLKRPSPRHTSVTGAEWSETLE